MTNSLTWSLGAGSPGWRVIFRSGGVASALAGVGFSSARTNAARHVAGHVAGNDSAGETVALFERAQVAAVVAKAHLVSEERCDPITGPYADPRDADIPF